MLHAAMCAKASNSSTTQRSIPVVRLQHIVCVLNDACVQLHFRRANLSHDGRILQCNAAAEHVLAAEMRKNHARWARA